MRQHTRACYLCTNKHLQKTTTRYSLHKFPSDTSTRLMWLQACDLTERDNVSNLKICSKHFLPSNYINPSAKALGGRLSLKAGAVPSVKVPNPPCKSELVNAIPAVNIALQPPCLQEQDMIGEEEIELEGHLALDLDESIPSIQLLNPCKPELVDVTPTVNESLQLPSLQDQDVIDEQEISFEELMFLENMNIVMFDQTYSVQSCAHTVSTDPLDEEPIQQSAFSTKTASLSALPAYNTSLNPNNTIPVNSLNTRFAEPRYVGDVTNADLATPERARLCLDIAKRTLEKQTRKIKVLQQANRRLQKRVETLKALLKGLPQKRLEYDDDTDTYVLVV